MGGVSAAGEGAPAREGGEEGTERVGPGRGCWNHPRPGTPRFCCSPGRAETSGIAGRAQRRRRRQQRQRQRRGARGRRDREAQHRGADSSRRRSASCRGAPGSRVRTRHRRRTGAASSRGAVPDPPPPSRGDSSPVSPTPAVCSPRHPQSRGRPQPPVPGPHPCSHPTSLGRQGGGGRGAVGVFLGAACSWHVFHVSTRICSLSRCRGDRTKNRLRDPLAGDLAKSLPTKVVL